MRFNLCYFYLKLLPQLCITLIIYSSEQIQQCDCVCELTLYCCGSFGVEKVQYGSLLADSLMPSTDCWVLMNDKRHGNMCFWILHNLSKNAYRNFLMNIFVFQVFLWQIVRNQGCIREELDLIQGQITSKMKIPKINKQSKPFPLCNVYIKQRQI